MRADESAIEHLASVGRRRKRGLKLVNETTKELPALVRAAHKAGHPKTLIAEKAGISRPTLDAMLKDY